MTSSLALVVLLAALAAGLAWFLTGRRLPHRAEPGDVVGDPDTDPEVLSEAEEEVRGVDAFTSPEDAKEDLPDWGPGAPKP